MSESPRLAMLIPAYNAAAHLPRLLDSAARQTHPFDEIWVYDDCSSDDTAAVAESYGARIVRGTINRGCSHGKNRLASETRCDWIHFHDADDELMPNFVERARIWMEESRFDVVLFGFEERNDRTHELMNVWRFDPRAVSLDPRAFAIRNQINSICGLYRREPFLKAGGYDEDPLVLYNEDAAFHIRLAFQGLSFTADETVAIINHRRNESMSASNQLRCLQANFQLLSRTAASESARPYVGDIARRLWVTAAGLAAHLDWRTADDAATLAVRLAGRSSAPASAVFKVLCWCSPRLAIRVRECLIRLTRPYLRLGFPLWRPSSL